MIINKALLIRLAGEGAYQRGVTVYENGGVLSIKEKAGHVFANVKGTNTYKVTLQITDKILDGSCNCPASENFDFCKHCVATALAYQEKQIEQSKFQKSDPLERIKAYINQLSEQEAKDALFQLVSNDELLTNKWQLNADNAAGTIDIKELKKQITKALPYRDLWEYAKVRAYFTHAETTLEPIFEIFTALDIEDVFSLAQYMSQRLNKLLERLDDSGGYRFGLENQINRTLTNTFKLLPWTANKKSQFLLRALENQDLKMVYPDIPEDFLDDSTSAVNTLFYQAIQDKWDALPNLHHGASYAEKTPYNHLLNILLHQVLDEKNIEKEIILKTKVAVEVIDFIELAKLNLAQANTDERIKQAEHWLEKAQTHQDKFRHAIAIKRLKITLFETKKNYPEALTIQWQIFTKTEQFNDYQILLGLAEKSGIDKATCNQQAEAVLIKNTASSPQNRWHSSIYNLIEFYLQNKQLNKAAQYAKSNQVDTHQLQQIARKIISLDTDLAFQFYQRIALFYPQQTNNAAYQQTIDILDELKQGLPDDTHWQEKFDTLINEIKQTYKAKRNLMKLLMQNFG